MSAETKAKLSESLKRSWANREPSEKQREVWRSWGRAGNTPEARRKHAATISKTMRGRERSPAQKAVLEAAQEKLRQMRVQGELPPRKPKYGLFLTFGETLREQDGDLCQLCLEPIDFALPIRTKWSRSVDHIIPAFIGGEDSLENCWLAHLRCNQSKGARYIGRVDGSSDRRVA
jgi:hypothetical protein